MNLKIAYIISGVNKSVQFEWIADLLDKNKFSLCFILLNTSDSDMERYLRSINVPVYRIFYTNKMNILSAFFSCFKILKREKVDMVHCHLLDASLVGLAAAKIAGIKKRIYTRHYSTLHHQYFPKGVLIDRFINSLSTEVIAISEVVRTVVKDLENVKENKITLVHHGFMLDKFRHKDQQLVNELEKKYNPDKRRPVIGVISRYVDWKGIQYIIPAFQKLLSEFPHAYLILANANGEYKEEIQQHLSKLPSESYTEIAFEKDLYSLYHLFDVFVHVPINDSIEAFGQVYIEALAAGVPSVFTLSGVANECVVDGENAMVVRYKNSEDIFLAIRTLLTDPDLYNRLKNGNSQMLYENFDYKKMIMKLESIYQKKK